MAEVLSGLVARELRVGVFSDYPVADKLEAMGLRAADHRWNWMPPPRRQRVQTASARAGGRLRALEAGAR